MLYHLEAMGIYPLSAMTLQQYLILAIEVRISPV